MSPASSTWGEWSEGSMFIWVNVSDPIWSDGSDQERRERDKKRARRSQLLLHCLHCPQVTPIFPHPCFDWSGCQQQSALHPLWSPSSLPPSLSRPLSPCSSSVNESSHTQAVHSTASLARSLSCLSPLGSRQSAEQLRTVRTEETLNLTQPSALRTFTAGRHSAALHIS